jgi:hypothetical protein
MASGTCPNEFLNFVLMLAETSVLALGKCHLIESRTDALKGHHQGIRQTRIDDLLILARNDLINFARKGSNRNFSHVFKALLF